ncbi:PadR family transcriptional regulator [Actinomycetospora straminea]|uniref:PadR family transcriptional regulator n=1 Tax=Actinomycetospora straminea TaxID=663607 RepID=A0ABP9EWP2_9PSEU|nr:PadR family transcriptional regulator [Actinomycetospora straminea]MDD7933567.1 PadR family transcriptional regulator [Actinomycetospora straminea]
MADRLSPTSYVVLGTIALRGPSTSYDLKRAVGRSIGYFWHFPHAQLYSEPQRLVELGLLEAETEAEGRRRRTFRLTDAGLAELRAWLAEPTPEHFQMRDIAELKLFFNEVGETRDVVRLAREQVAAHRERIAVYEDMQARYADLDAVAKRMITLRLGLEMEHAALRFWSSLLEEVGPSAVRQVIPDAASGS